MNNNRTDWDARENSYKDDNGLFKKPQIRIALPAPSFRDRRLNVPRISIGNNTNNNNNNNNDNNTKTRPVKRGGKIKLKPGHSALDWNHKVATLGIKGELITGLSDLRNDETFLKINHKSTINQLNMRIPPFKIRPPIIINREILFSNQIDHKIDFWCVLNGKVYCLTHYLDFHPGGVDILLKYCKDQRNPDAIEWFNKYHRWVSYEKLLETCLIGKFINE